MSSNLSHTGVRKIAVEQADATSAPGHRLAVQVMCNMSKELEGGSPSVYKLQMNEEMRHTESMIARQSFGAPNHIELGETEKVFMLVGGTAAGKTTLINGMVNYILGVQWKDEFRFKCITEETKAAQAYSQTQDITAYTFHPMKGSAVPYIFTVIDTPGYTSTEGLERDENITKQIKQFFSITPPDGIDHLDGIGFVVQASQPRLTSMQKYTFDSILSIFGNDVSKNIFLMITFADGQSPPVLAAIEEAKIPSHSERHFKFNSSALFARESKTKLDEECWEMCLHSFKVFFEEFPKAVPVSLSLTREVLNEREQLYVLIQGLSDQIARHLNKVEEMRQEEIVLQQHKKEIETNQPFTFTVDVTKPFKLTPLKETGLHTTTCETCFTTCHTNCPITDDKVKHNCLAMDADGNCRICPGKCKWSVHKNLPFLIQYKTITETRTAKHLIEKYQKALQQKARSEQMIEWIKESLQDIHIQVLKTIKMAQQSLRRLDEIALKPNPVTQVEYLELLIKSEKREAKPGWMQRIQYLETVKRHAKLFFKVKNKKESQKLVQTLSRDGNASEERKTSESPEKLPIDGDNFYSRFQWSETSEISELP